MWLSFHGYQLALCRRYFSFHFSHYSDKFAIQSRRGNRFTYNDVNALSFGLHRIIESRFGSSSLCNKIIGILLPSDVEFVIGLLASWLSKSVVIPFADKYPLSYLAALVKRFSVHAVITDKNLKDIVPSNVPCVLINEHFRAESDALSDEHFNFPDDQPALILNTSGSTGQPKGVVLTHGNLSFQTASMIEAWKWNCNDVILNLLPLNHIHGLVNCLLTPLACGAACVFSEFNPSKVWSQLTSPIAGAPGITLFMAVPTIYSRLHADLMKNVRSLDRHSSFRDLVRSVCENQIRLFISGSAPLSENTFNDWFTLTGRKILERYGMTETGMILSNTPGSIAPGSVGFPMPFVNVRLVDSGGNVILNADRNSVSTLTQSSAETVVGQILVKGPTVFSHYFNDESERKNAFTEDNWFVTGDIAKYDKCGGFSLLGRESVDIIKVGGVKISALNIERHLLDFPAISDCAVLGIEDLTWGQKIAAVITVKPKHRKPTLVEIRNWLRNRLPPDELPTVLKIVNTLTRTDVGKVNKKLLLKEYFDSS